MNTIIMIKIYVNENMFHFLVIVPSTELWLEVYLENLAYNFSTYIKVINDAKGFIGT